MTTPHLELSEGSTASLKRYAEMVSRFGRAINLVSRNDTDDIWDRHILDCAQLRLVAPLRVDVWLDLGSGGGFPGIVMAILMKESQPAARFILVDADLRKCVFLREVARTLSLSVEVLHRRIEDVSPAQASVVSARALAPLCDLCTMAHRHLAADGTGLFMKGALHKDEVDEARATWSFDLTTHMSLSDPAAAILETSRPLPRPSAP